MEKGHVKVNRVDSPLPTSIASTFVCLISKLYACNCLVIEIYKLRPSQQEYYNISSAY